MPRTQERRIPAGRFKATCLALLDEVAVTRRGFIVTKRGRPVARVTPVDDRAPDLAGSIVFEHDIVAPLDEAWDAES
jgi:prevent-host-death family protein